MDTVNLARGADWSGLPGAVASLWRWAVQHPLVVLAIVAALAIYSVWAYRWSKRQAHEPSADKATLRGTARVLAFKQTKAMTNSQAISSELTGYSHWDKSSPYWCKIRLEVHIPGRDPYVSVIRKMLKPAQRSAVQTGNTVQVRIDPNDDPKNVLIDLNPPIT
jgi:hypothetical protein